jgi:hypothetical protein
LLDASIDLARARVKVVDHRVSRRPNPLPVMLPSGCRPAGAVTFRTYVFLPTL